MNSQPQRDKILSTIVCYISSSCSKRTPMSKPSTQHSWPNLHRSLGKWSSFSVLSSPFCDSVCTWCVDSWAKKTRPISHPLEISTWKGCLDMNRLIWKELEMIMIAVRVVTQIVNKDTLIVSRAAISTKSIEFPEHRQGCLVRSLVQALEITTKDSTERMETSLIGTVL